MTAESEATRIGYSVFDTMVDLECQPCWLILVSNHSEQTACQNTASGVTSESHRLAARTPVAELDSAVEQQQPAEDSVRVFDLLQRYAAEFVASHPRQAVPQVQSTLARLDSTRQLLLQGITYFQVVFTIPDKLS